MVRPVRVVLISCVIGVVAGVVASGIRARRIEAELLAESARGPRSDKRAASSRPKTYELAGKETYVDPEAVKYLPEYPKAIVTDLAETTLAQGVPMKAGMFLTTDKLEDVLGWYEIELEKAGWNTVSQHWGDGAAYVGFYGPDKRMHTVALMRSGSQTVVLLANSDPEAFLRAKSKVQPPAGLPALPAATGELSFSFGDPGIARQTYVANAGAMTLAQAKAFYEAGLGKAGWRIEETTEQLPKQIRIVATRGAENLSLTLAKDERENHVAVYAHLLARR